MSRVTPIAFIGAFRPRGEPGAAMFSFLKAKLAERAGGTMRVQ